MSRFEKPLLRAALILLCAACVISFAVFASQSRNAVFVAFANEIPVKGFPVTIPVDSPDSPIRFLRGWEKPEVGGRWTQEGYVTMFTPLPEAAKEGFVLQLEFDRERFQKELGVYQFAVQVGNSPLFQGELPSEGQKSFVWSGQVHPSDLEDHAGVVITMKIFFFKRPEEASNTRGTQRRGFFLKSISVLPVGPDMLKETSRD